MIHLQINPSDHPLKHVSLAAFPFSVSDLPLAWPNTQDRPSLPPTPHTHLPVVIVGSAFKLCLASDQFSLAPGSGPAIGG